MQRLLEHDIVLRIQLAGEAIAHLAADAFAAGMKIDGDGQRKGLMHHRMPNPD